MTKAVISAPDDAKIRICRRMALYASEDVALGTLCVIDTAARSLPPIQTKTLAILGHPVPGRLELRYERRKLLCAPTSNREPIANLRHNKQSPADANSQLDRIATTNSLTETLKLGTLEKKLDAEFAHALQKQLSLSRLPCVTLSIGIACLEKLTTNWDGLLAQAHCAAYKAKQAVTDRFLIDEAPDVA